MELRKKYKNRDSYIILKGLVEIDYYRNYSEKEVFGTISRLSTESIYVPLKHRNVLEGILLLDKPTRRSFQPPRYKVKLAYGSRLEPWIVSIDSLDDKSD